MRYDEWLRESVVVRWLVSRARALLSPARRQQLVRWRVAVVGVLQETPPQAVGIILSVAVLVNLLGLLVLGRAPSGEGLIGRTLIVLLAVCAARSSLDWHASAQQSRLIRRLKGSAL